MSIMIGVAHEYQDKDALDNWAQPNSYCLSSWTGSVCYDRTYHDYTTPFHSGPRTVEMVLDMDLPSLRFKINGEDKGVAFNGHQLKQGPYFLTVFMCGSDAVTILKSVHEVKN